MSNIILYCLQQGIKEIQIQLLSNPNITAIDEKKDMHKTFKESILSHLPSNFEIKDKRRDIKYGIGSIANREADFVILGPKKQKIFFELVMSDIEPKKSFESNMKKGKVAKDFAKLAHPDLRKFRRFFLFGIRWDIAGKQHYSEGCINECRRNPKLRDTDLFNLQNKRYKERGFFFGDNFCFDFSIYYGEFLVQDISTYKQIRN